MVVDSPVADLARREFERRGAYFLSTEEAKQLGSKLFPKGQLNPELVGHSAQVLAAKAGIQVPADTQLLMVEQSYVPVEPVIAKNCCVLFWRGM